MYGKFLNHLLSTGVAEPCEMFFDLTPGTPPIYRRDLLFKLFRIGYDVENNILFGTDSILPDYNPKWVAGWMARDAALYSELGVSDAVVKKIYCDNIRRFLGLDNVRITHRPPEQTVEAEL